jgi:hypothetical protein
MARRSKAEKAVLAGPLGMTERLALIKRRHRELILRAREAVAADFTNELDDPYEDVLGADEVEMVEAVGTGRL